MAFIKIWRQNLPYLIVFAGLWINFCEFAFLRSSSVLYNAFLTEFKCTYAEASWPFSFVGAIASILTLFTGFLAHFISPQIIVSLGVIIISISLAVASQMTSIWGIIWMSALQGMGIGFFVCNVPVVISGYFDQGRSTAIGISWIGSTFCGIFFPIFIQYLLQYKTTQDVLLILSFFSFFGLFAGLLMIPAKKKNLNENSTNIIALNEKNSITISSNELSKKNERLGVIQYLKKDVYLLTNPALLMISLMYVVFIYTYLCHLIVLQTFAEERKLSKLQANSLVMYMAFGDLAGRISPGLLHYYGIVNNRQTYIGSMFLLATSFLLLPNFAVDYTSFILLSILTGTMNGVQMVQTLVIMTEYLGVQNTGVGSGIINVISGLFSFLRPALIDYVRKTTGKYDMLFYVTGFMCLISIIPWTFERKLCKFQELNKKNPVPK